jgi:hypothetical protein
MRVSSDDLTEIAADSIDEALALCNALGVSESEILCRLMGAINVKFSDIQENTKYLTDSTRDEVMKRIYVDTDIWNGESWKSAMYHGYSVVGLLEMTDDELVVALADNEHTPYNQAILDLCKAEKAIALTNRLQKE